MAPAPMASWISAAAGNFLFRLLLGGDVELPGHRGRQPAATSALPILYVGLSLRIFRLVSSRSLSLGEGGRPALGDGTRADGVLDQRRRRQFSFSLIAWGRRRATGSSRQAAGRDERAAYSMSDS